MFRKGTISISFRGDWAVPFFLQLIYILQYIFCSIYFTFELDLAFFVHFLFFGYFFCKISENFLKKESYLIQ
jgi:hypothetical protein